MNAVFLKILNMSLTASLLILAVLPIRLLMKKAPKWTICLLWLIVAVALVAPVRLESSASVLPMTDPIPITVITEGPPTPSIQQSETAPSKQMTMQTAAEPTASAPTAIEIGTAVWLLGMVALLSYAAFSWLRLKRRVAVSIETAENVYVCDDIDTPFILGVLRPHIYLPSALDEVTVQQVLTHEWAHLARKDHWWKPLGYLLLTVHWFNPLVWVAYSLLCSDIELACDEKVIKDMDPDSKKAYSEALLDCSMPRHLIAACPLAFGEVSVKQRIRAVLHYKKPAFWAIMIAIVICVGLCAGFLTEPKVTTLGNMSEITVAEVISITVHENLSTARSVADTETVCELLSELELRKRIGKAHIDTDWAVISLDIKNDTTAYHLHFSPDRTRLWLEKQESVTSIFGNGTYYEVLNPDLVVQILYGEYLYEPLDASPEAPDLLTFAEMQTMLEEYLRNKNRHFDNLQIFHFSAHDLVHNMSYAIVTLDHLSHEGIVTAENCLYLVAFTNDRVDGMVSGQWPGAAGYYPNVADFNGNFVLWSVRSATRAALNKDGTINPDETVPNDYDEYRITYDDGNTSFYPIDEGRGDNPMIVFFPQSPRPVKIAPIDYYGFEVKAFTFTEDQMPVTNVNTVSEVSGWDVFLNMNVDTGEILSVNSHPTLQKIPVYPDMDESFQGHEALYDAIKTYAPLELQETKGILLDGTKSLDGENYAIIHCSESKFDDAFLLEYETNSNGTVSILNYAQGTTGESFGNFGYSMNYVLLSGKSLYWTTFGDERWATTKDGKKTDTSKTVPTDYTGFRFIWADLHQIDYSADEGFFLAEVDSVIPPAISIPMVGSKALSALGRNLS